MGTRQHTSAADELVGQHAKDIRILEGRSQASIVEAMQGRGHPWHQTTVSRVERGLRPLSLAEAASLSEIYVQPVVAFLGRGYTPKLPGPLEIVDNISRDARELRSLIQEKDN